MIVEVRTYRVREGMRDRFLELFETRSVPLQRSKGMGIVGPLVDLENPDVFVWLRTFPSLAERERMTREFEEDPAWKDGLRAIVLPMLHSYTVALTEASPGFFADLPETARTAREATPAHLSPAAGGAVPHPARDAR